MDTNLTAFGYYPADDSYFLDPMYAPYARRNTQTSDGSIFPVNTTEVQGYHGFVRPELVRKAWSLDFQRKHSSYPCPAGWKAGGANWCIKVDADYGDSGLYSKNAFIARHQYQAGYTVPRTPAHREFNQSDNKSVNPHTGHYVVYQRPSGTEVRSQYGGLPSKAMLLA